MDLRGKNQSNWLRELPLNGMESYKGQTSGEGGGMLVALGRVFPSPSLGLRQEEARLDNKAEKVHLHFRK